MIIDLDDGFIHISGEINDEVDGNP